jgi:5-methyltetrahydrofolate--homocysteine methyltransferase
MAAMQTIIRSGSQEVIIDIESPFVIIGESINPTGHKKLKQALQEENYDYVRDLAVRQVEAGADILDVNVGVPGLDEAKLLPKVIGIVASVVDVPICIDSADPKALAAGLEATPGKPLVNSVNGEEAMLDSVLPLVKEYGSAVIGLTMDDDGIPVDPETRVAIAGKIIERAAKLGIEPEDIVIDPLVMSIGADSQAGATTLVAIEAIRKEFGVNINLGASNVSFGLPDRHTINQAFLALAIYAGSTCAITSAMKLTATIRAIDLVRGKDEYAGRFISHYRAMKKREG